MPTIAQRALIDRIASVLEADPRVEAAWLSGSLGRGEGDELSDVDALVLVGDGKIAEVSAAYAGDPSPITEPLLVNALFGGRVVNVVTGAWERFDLVFVESLELGRFDAARLTPLFNRSGHEPSRKATKPYKTDPDRLLKLVNEFLRVVGLGPVGLGRGEYIVSLTGVELLRRMTLDLMLEENGIDPSAVGGALGRNRFLTEEQRCELEGLPPLQATRESLIASDEAISHIFLPRARKLAAKIGMAWPTAFEKATREHVRTKLGMKF